VKTYDASNFKDVPAPKPSNWIVEGFFKTHQKRPSLLVGLAEGGKSTLATQLAVNVMQGEPFLGRATHKSKVIFWKYEDSAEDAKDDFRRAGFREGDLLVLLIPDAGDDNVQCLADTLAANPDTKLVIIETILDFLAIKDSNSTEAVKAELKKFNDRITEAYPDCVFLLLHHLNKSDMAKDSLSLVKINGSHAFATATATKMYLHRISDQDPRRYIYVSVRRGKELEPTYLVFDKATGISTLGETLYAESTRAKAQVKEVRDQDLTSRIIQAVDENAGLAKSALVSKIGGNRQKALARIDELVAQKILTAVEGISSRGGIPPQQIYVKGQEPRLSQEELFERFEAATANKSAMATFYGCLHTNDKVVIWNKYPEHHEALEEGVRQ